MKHLIPTFMLLMVIGCHRTLAPWPSEGDKQDVTMYVRARSLSGISATPSVFQFFIHDPSRSVTTCYNLSVTESADEQLHLKLFPGTYTGYCITQAEDMEHWEYTENYSPEKIFLKANKAANRDHLLGESHFTIQQTEPNDVIFDLNRKVGMLRIIIENIPEWLTDLQINLSNIPQKMSLTGQYSGNGTITKAIGIPDENGTSVTSLLVFPPHEKAILTLSSQSMVFVTPEHPIKIKANRQTEIKVIFKDPTEMSQVNILTEIIDWNDTILQEEDWEIDRPAGPCQGSGNGMNLVANGSFEEDFTDLPDAWKATSNSENPPQVVSVNSPVQEGNKAVRVEGKTYLYQDVPVVGGTCYQLKLYVNAPNHHVKWRSWCTWMQGSKTLPSDALHSSSYQYETDGYIDVYQGKIFRAPVGATKLRVEVRNYMDPIQGEGLYVDAVSVEAVE